MHGPYNVKELMNLTDVWFFFVKEAVAVVGGDEHERWLQAR